MFSIGGAYDAVVPRCRLSVCVIAASAVLAGCGAIQSSAPSRSPTARLSGAAKPRPTIDLAKFHEAERLQAATYRLQRLTFTGTWTYHFRSKTTKVTVSQIPPATLFSMSDGAEDLTTPTGIYLVCANGMRCPATVANDFLFTTRGLFTGIEMSDALASYRATLTNAPSGITLRFSDASFAGLRSTCISLFGGRNLSQEWCITSSGIIAYGHYAHRSLYLTSYKGSAPPNISEIPVVAISVNN
jgi:hypothetical protein